MGTVPRGDGSENHDDATPAPEDEATPDADVGGGDDEPVVGPIPDKIGEGGTNLRDRNAALGRRRGGDRPSP
jgi:hypothetical protein